MDESTFGLHPVLRQCWMKRGCQKRIPTPGQQTWHHLFAAYNYVTDQVVHWSSAKKNSDAFVAFLDHLLQTVPKEQPVLLVLDNASYHTSQAAQAAFACFEHRLLPLFLPPYCSDLNPIERFWRHLKENACANFLFEHIQALSASVEHWLTKQNDPHDPERFLISKSFQ